MTRSDGYRDNVGNGSKIRADVVDVYVFTRVSPTDAREKGRAPRAYESEPEWKITPRSAEAPASAVHFLQLLRSGAPLDATWHPVMGHVEPGETATQAAMREMREELGLSTADSACMGVWALEQVHPFYIAAIDSIVMSPRFVVEVAPSWTPRLNAENSGARWVRHDQIDSMFMWPGQKACCCEIIREIVNDASLSREHLRVKV